jgi:hypothetical protein
MTRIKIFADWSQHNPILNELLTNKLVVVDTLKDADVVAVFFSRNVVRFVENLLTKPGHNFNILIEPIPHDFNSNRVHMINTKLRDLCIANYKNYLFGLEVVHIDFSFVYRGLNLKAEVINCLSVVGDIIGWENYDNRLKLRFSYNDNSVHVSGYIREMNFTLSIFISNTMFQGYNETIKVFTKSDGIFTLDSDNHDHNYGERYGAAIQKILEESVQNNHYYQFKLKSVIKSCLGPGGSKRTVNKTPRSGCVGATTTTIVKRFSNSAVIRTGNR